MVDDTSHPANGGKMVNKDRSSSPDNNSEGKVPNSLPSLCLCKKLHNDIANRTSMKL
jgi:hypothetical protein